VPTQNQQPQRKRRSEESSMSTQYFDLLNEFNDRVKKNKVVDDITTNFSNPRKLTMLESLVRDDNLRGVNIRMTHQYRKSTLTDPHIKNIITEIAKAHNISEQTVANQIKSEIQHATKKFGVSPTLTSDMADQMVDAAIFTILRDGIVLGDQIKHVRVGSGPKFDYGTFDKLLKRIFIEQNWEFGLRSIRNPKPLHNKVVYVTHYEKTNSGKIDKTPYDDIGTAAMVPKKKGGALFVFNAKFMQALLDYAHLMNYKSPKRKYASKGGPFPDEYAYIEFVILHEFLHYKLDDMYLEEILDDFDHMAANWAADFRINHELVKMGNPHFPGGLISNNFNRDTHETFTRLYKEVKAELDKMSEEDKKDLVKITIKGGNDKHAEKKPGDTVVGLFGKTKVVKVPSGGQQSPQPPAKKQPNPPWVPAVGDIVRVKDNKKKGRIVNIDNTGKIHVEELPDDWLPAEVQDEINKNLNV
jgi:hypothetical protein